MFGWGRTFTVLAIGAAFPAQAWRSENRVAPADPRIAPDAPVVTYRPLSINRTAPDAPTTHTQRATFRRIKEPPVREYTVQVFGRTDYEKLDRVPFQTMFKDIPEGGTGRLEFIYFGERNPALDARARQAGIHTRVYPHYHNIDSGIQAYAVDGLGRKLSRYAMSPEMGLESLIRSNERQLLAAHLAEKKRQANINGPSDRRTWGPPPGSPGTTQAFHDAVDKCVGCHAGLDLGAGAPANVKSAEGLKRAFDTMSKSLLEEMMSRVQLSKEEADALKEFAASKRKHGVHLASYNRPVDQSGQQACFLTPATQHEKASSLPQIDGDASSIADQFAMAKDANQLVFYDRSQVPRTWINSFQGRLLSEGYHTNPLSMRKMGYHGSGGREFPWQHSAGMDIAANGSSDKFYIPPADGKILKMVTRTNQNSPKHFGRAVNIQYPRLGWQYKAGMTFGEVLKVNGVPFEIRLRTKKSDGTWAFDVLRPFENAMEVYYAIIRVCGTASPPASCEDPKMMNVYNQLRNPRVAEFTPRNFLNRRTLGTPRDPLSLNSTALQALAPKATLQVMPEIPQDVVRAILTTTPFKSVMGKPWTKGPPPGWAPTTASYSSIVPKNYFGGLVPLTQQACMKCHATAGAHVDNVSPSQRQMWAPLPGDAARPRSWYDNVHGDDATFSFQPFGAQAVKRAAGWNMNSINPCLKRYIE